MRAIALGLLLGVLTPSPARAEGEKPLTSDGGVTRGHSQAGVTSRLSAEDAQISAELELLESFEEARELDLMSELTKEPKAP